MPKLTIASRKSPLALAQTKIIQDALMQHHSELEIDVLPMSTEGDILLDTNLVEHGGKGLFIKELEVALLDKRADIAVHSMKDMPADLPSGLVLPVICTREDPRDVFVSHLYDQLADLPSGAVVGTASLRRQSQLLAWRSDLQIKLLRGNVNTRLRKLADGEYDAIILAAAGLKRMQFSDQIKQYIEPDFMIPAVGQGAIGIECRSDDDVVKDLISALHDCETAYCVRAERAVTHRLASGCHVPLGAYATLDNELELTAMVASPDGQTLIKATHKGDKQDAESIGTIVAEKLIEQGAEELLHDYQ